MNIKKPTTLCNSCHQEVRRQQTWQTEGFSKFTWCVACTAINFLELDCQRYKITGPPPDERDPAEAAETIFYTMIQALALMDKGRYL